MKLKMEYADINSFILDPKNARTHSEAQLAQIEASIREFGFNDPIATDTDMGVIEGHGRIIAAKKLGIAQLPYFNLTHLTKTQKRAYMIAHNKIAMNAGWSDDLLKIELLDLKDLDFDLSLVGFDGPELAEIMYGPEFAPVGEDEQGRLDQKKPIKCPGCGLEFTQ